MAQFGHSVKHTKNLYKGRFKKKTLFSPRLQIKEKIMVETNTHDQEYISQKELSSPENKNRILMEGPLVKTLLKFTIPISLTILFQIGYGTADLLILGQFASIADLSGATIGGRLLQLLMTFFIGLSVAVTIMIGRAIGQKKIKEISNIIGTSILLYTIIGLITTSLLIYFANDIIQILNTPKESAQQAHDYLVVCSLGIIFIVHYNLFGCTYRGFGDSKTPLITVFVGCMINIVLDFIFIIGFGMGAMGAALATVLAQGLSLALSLLYIKRKGFPYSVTLQNFKINFTIAVDLLKLGSPAALQSILVNISFLAITSIINEFGVVASASVGIVERISGVLVVLPLGFMQALAAFAAQNNGAKKYGRSKKGLQYALLFSSLFGILTGYLSFFHGIIFISIFTSDPETTVNAILYLKSYALDCLFVAIMFTINGYFSGCGKTTFVMLQCVFGALCFRIPLAHYLANLENTSLFIIGLATPASTLVQLMIGFSYYYFYQKKFSCK